MKTIFKYHLFGPGETTSNRMPNDFQVVKFGMQDGMFVMWALIDKDAHHRYVHKFKVVGTGWDIEEDEKYIDTIQVGEFVWHLVQKVRVVE